MRVRLAFGAAAATVAIAAAFASTGGTNASVNCSRDEALRVGKPFFWDATYTVRQVLCGPFTGEGSDAMAMTFAAPTCWSPQGWAVFRYSDGDWQLVLHRRRAFIFPLAVVGTNIRETAPVFRAGDPRCLPSGGKHARTWSWNGTALAAGPWKQTERPKTPGGLPRLSFFKTPSGNIVCVHAAWPTGPILECKIKSGLKPKPPYDAACRASGLDHNADRISLPARGRVPYPEACWGDAGATSMPGRRPVLGYGQTWSRGGMSCRSEFTGLTCRNRSRHGFFLSRARWRRF